VSISQSSSIFKKTISREVFLQLSELWSQAVKTVGNNTLLITEETLLNLTKNEQNVFSKKQLEIQKFQLLITPYFNALVWGKPNKSNNSYQTTITFEREVIATYLIQLIRQSGDEAAAVEYLQSDFINQLTENVDYSHEFVIKAINLLMNSHNLGDRRHHNGYNNTPVMERPLPYQVEQQHILNRLKIQISQDLSLREIIQAAIEQSRHVLGLDRLLIYQLDVPLKSMNLDSAPSDFVDTVTYEAKIRKDIASTLYFQDEICLSDFPQCKNKYRQGFSLAINDIETSPNLNSCLQSLMCKLQVRAKLVTPILVKGKVWGLAIAHQCFEPRQWDNQEIEFLRQIAEYLAIAIYHNQSYQQLQKQKKLLEKQVKTQAQQIKNALIAAQVASQSKHEFIGSMSHELRTPLTSVIGLSGTLLQWSSSKEHISLPIEKQHQYLQLIQQSGKHLLTLINNILEFSEVESGKHLLNIQQISLANVAQQALQILKEKAQKKQISLSFELKVIAEQDCFFADQERLKEILFNLITNGIEFTPEQGQVTLRIWREKNQVVFQVEDTGIGIAQEQIPLLFEKFKQLEDFRRRTHGGTGLGLALTKQLVELHGGNIEVESVLGNGSVFTVYLPEKTSFKHQTEQQVTITPKLPLRSRTIMLVSEDEENATFICQLLTAIGYQVVWLVDSTMAINQIELVKPDAVIIDRDCSEIAVQSIGREIEKQRLSDRLSVVLLCHQLTNNDWQYFLDHGVNDYLLKSMNPNQIIDKINASIKNKDEPKDWQASNSP
jgi:two-component system, sensor histidine kinase and response regulator